MALLPITRIKKDSGFLPQLFYRLAPAGSSGSVVFNIVNIIKEHTPSTIALLDDQSKVLKLIKPRRWHEYIKLLTARSRLSKEVRGNFILRSLGIGVPKIYEYGLGLFPTRQYKYIGYYVMENLNMSSYEDVSSLIWGDKLSDQVRYQLFENVFNDILIMRDNRIVFSDITYGNIFSDKEGKIIWIDTGVTTYSRFNNKKFKEKYNFSLNRFLTIHKDSFTEKECERAKAILFDI